MKLFTALALVAFLATANADPLFLKHKLKHLPGLGGPKVFPFLGLTFGGAKKEGHETVQETVQETVREVQVVHEKPVEHTVYKDVQVNVVREEPYERVVKVNRPVDVVKTVPIERVNYVDRPYEVVKEVPVERVVHKRVEVPREVQVPFPVEVAVPRLVHVPVEVEKVTTVDRPVEVVKHVKEVPVAAAPAAPLLPNLLAKLPKPQVTVGVGVLPGKGLPLPSPHALKKGRRLLKNLLD